MIEVVSVPDGGAVLQVLMASNLTGEETSSDQEIATLLKGVIRFTGRKFGKVDVLRGGEVIYSFEAVQYPAVEVRKVEEIAHQYTTAVVGVADCSGSDGGSCGGGE